jgi:hypothetical protein
MNRKIRRPARALHASGAARVGQSATHLFEGRLGVLPAKAGIRGVSYGQSRDQKRRYHTSNDQPQSVSHVVSPQPNSGSGAQSGAADRSNDAAKF